MSKAYAIAVEKIKGEEGKQKCRDKADPHPPVQCCARCQSTGKRCQLRGIYTLGECHYCPIHIKTCNPTLWTDIHKYDTLFETPLLAFAATRRKLVQDPTRPGMIPVLREAFLPYMKRTYLQYDYATILIAALYVSAIRSLRQKNCYPGGGDYGHRYHLQTLLDFTKVIASLTTIEEFSSDHWTEILDKALKGKLTYGQLGIVRKQIADALQEPRKTLQIIDPATGLPITV